MRYIGATLDKVECDDAIHEDKDAWVSIEAFMITLVCVSFSVWEWGYSSCLQGHLGSSIGVRTNEGSHFYFLWTGLGDEEGRKANYCAPGGAENNIRSARSVKTAVLSVRRIQCMPKRIRSQVSIASHSIEETSEKARAMAMASQQQRASLAKHRLQTCLNRRKSKKRT